MIKCSKCGRENDDSFTFCLDCGNPLKPAAPTPEASAPTAPAAEPKQAAEPKPAAPPTEPKAAAPEPKPAAKCPKCGAVLKSDDVFCSACGHKIGEEVVKRTSSCTSPPPKSPRSPGPA